MFFHCWGIEKLREKNPTMYFYHLYLKGLKVLRNTIYDIHISKSRPSRVTVDMNHWLSTTVKSDIIAKKMLCKV